MKEYTKLNKAENYDKEAAAELADVLNEVEELGNRLRYLNQLVDENGELHPFIWRTAEGQHIALHNIGDDHLTNIINHLISTGRNISKQIRGEAHKRNINIPASTNLSSYHERMAELADINAIDGSHW